MRRVKKERRLLPYTAGLITGIAVTLILSAVLALFMLFTDSAEGFSGTAAVLITAAACFSAGRSGGRLRRREGIKTGALCGILYLLVLMLMSLIFGGFGSVMLWVKAVLAVVFGAVGGVVGVNSDDKR